MKMKEIIEIAKKWGIPFKIGLSKAELIWPIQMKEGYTACFRRDDGCEGKECLWKDDCIHSEHENSQINQVKEIVPA